MDAIVAVFMVLLTIGAVLYFLYRYSEGVRYSCPNCGAAAGWDVHTMSKMWGCFQGVGRLNEKKKTDVFSTVMDILMTIWDAFASLTRF